MVRSTLRLDIDMVYSDSPSPYAVKAAALIVEAMRVIASCRVAIHFDSKSIDLSGVVGWIERLRVFVERSSDIDISLVGPFMEPNDDSALERLFDLGVQLRFAKHTATEYTGETSQEEGEVALRALSEFGFRVPVVWYVSEESLSSVREELPRLLAASCYSGVAIPLVCVSPFYKFANGYPRLPDAIEYSELVVDCYQTYPHYDDTFFPLAELADLVAFGSWNETLGLSTALHLVIDNSGVVSAFRQAPSLAVRWLNVQDVIALDSDTIREQCTRFLRQTFRWSSNTYCKGCDLRKDCGGLDAFRGVVAASKKELDAMCAYRMLFLRHFSHVRSTASQLSKEDRT